MNHMYIIYIISNKHNYMFSSMKVWLKKIRVYLKKNLSISFSSTKVIGKFLLSEGTTKQCLYFYVYLNLNILLFKQKYITSVEIRLLFFHRLLLRLPKKRPISRLPTAGFSEPFLWVLPVLQGTVFINYFTGSTTLYITIK